MTWVKNPAIANLVIIFSASEVKKKKNKMEHERHALRRNYLFWNRGNSRTTSKYNSVRTSKKTHYKEKLVYAVYNGNYTKLIDNKIQIGDCSQASLRIHAQWEHNSEGKSMRGF